MQACTAQVPRHARQRRRRYTISGAHNLKPPTVCSDPTPHLPGWHWRAAPSARRRPPPPPPPPPLLARRPQEPGGPCTGWRCPSRRGRRGVRVTGPAKRGGGYSRRGRGHGHHWPGPATSFGHGGAPTPQGEPTPAPAAGALRRPGAAVLPGLEAPAPVAPSRCALPHQASRIRFSKQLL
jgi:hypothetical protein